MSSPWIVAVVTVAIIVLSAFFVAVEFSLIAAKRHRLEDAASTSRSARAALRSSTELTLLLAGSQLGITVCTLALGAITKPAVHHWLTPLFEAWGLAFWVADVAGFVLALIIVTFLHLVVGEMAPKSWAIAHPERSATLLALPMRVFMTLTRPLLRALNGTANWILERFGVEAVNEVATGQNPDALRHLVEHSTNVGALDARLSSQFSGALNLETLRVRDLLDGAPVTQVEPDATVAEVRAATHRSGHLRILVGTGPATDGLIHVRDTLLHEDATPVTDLVRPVFTLDPETKVYEALARMRETATHLAVVADQGRTVGVVTLSDVLRLLFPQDSRDLSTKPA
ncbi:HlyC/CorC family transporter [Ornithinimicrobium ciconiae]|uniref:HlyC/CorC family transporter n=1 Tax=Ornithinimicrobium ciconiae TaxID=2594265 RepID=A0A516G669_9MICO|nr:hemolysin family protein [Ornithinimicrobium ciconiae]QDO87009.1 HlyC/CorC family transporter [Ornithinimicrobium ciconiae]